MMWGYPYDLGNSQYGSAMKCRCGKLSNSDRMRIFSAGRFAHPLEDQSMVFFCDSCPFLFPIAVAFYPTTRTQPLTFSAVSEPPRLKQLDTAMMYLYHAANGSVA